MRKIFLFILISMLLVGCGSKEDTGDNNKIEAKSVEEKEQVDESQSKQQHEVLGYAFEHDGVTIYMNTDVEPVLDALGEPLQYFEAESCAFKGLDKTYTYAGFEITTYPMDGKDYISTVYLMDDTVSTPEGIYLGSSLDDMIAAYGDDYTGSSGSYTYIKEDSKLQFIVMNDEIIAITYLAVVEGLE